MEKKASAEKAARVFRNPGPSFALSITQPLFRAQHRYAVIRPNPPPGRGPDPADRSDPGWSSSSWSASFAGCQIFRSRPSRRAT